jgi:GT2 family glycosyltransferase/ADP-heptose:LPS heptosyltransferase
MEEFDDNNKKNHKEIINEINSLKIKLNEKETEIQKLLYSKSWRITKPLRKLAHLKRKIFYMIKDIIILVSWAKNNHHRLRYFFLKTIKIIYKEGGLAYFSKLQRFINKEKINFSNDEGSYHAWILRNDTINEGDREKIRQRIESFTHKPFFSVIMPVYNTNERYLNEAINSVKNQIYPFWELCIADDASSFPHVEKILNIAKESDERIKIVFRPSNGNISQASNSALEISKGDFIVLLDHDDSLSETALFLVAEEINAFPNSELIYSDEDKIDKNGKRFDPNFKPDWNFDLFMSFGYLCHLTVIKRSIIQKVGGFRLGVEGAQDYDLLLRCLLYINENQNIRHIPHILYHWRAYLGSTALSTNEKPYAHKAGLKSLQDFWKIKNPMVEVKDGVSHCNYRIIFPLPKPIPLVSILLASGGGFTVLKKCLESIRMKTTYLNYEILIDNGNNSEEVIKYLEELEKNWVVRIIRKIRPENYLFNYSKIINNLADSANGTIFVLLNDDTEIISTDWLDEFVRQTSRPEIGVVGAKLLYYDGSVQHAGIILGVGGEIGAHVFIHHKDSDPGYMSRAHVSQNLSAVTGACIAVRRDVFFKVNGLEEELAVTCNDVDFCLKVLEQGFRNLWTPYIKLFHSESATRGLDDSPEKQIRNSQEVDFMKKKWSFFINNDPAYNPNLSLEPNGFMIADKSRSRYSWKIENIINDSNSILNNGVKVENRGIFIPLKKKLEILVIKSDHRGDLLVALPALLRLREKFKESEIDLICGPWNLSLAKQFQIFRNIYPLNFFEEQSISGINRKKNEEKLLFSELGPYDLAIDLRIPSETRVLLSKVNANFKVGYKSYSAIDSLLDLCMDEGGNSNKHTSVKLLDLVEAIPFETFSFPKLSNIDKTGPNEIGVFPFAGSSARQWPLIKFVELVKELSQSIPDWKINVYIPPNETDKASFFDFLSSNINIIITSSLEEIIDSVSKCEIVIANNSFGAHLPGFLGHKIVIVIFSGVVSINDWRPALGEQKIYYSDVSCSPCYLGKSSDCPYDMICLSQISVKTILDAVISETKLSHTENPNDRLCYQIITTID